MRMFQVGLVLLMLIGSISPGNAQDFDYFGIAPPGETPEKFPFEKIIPSQFAVRNPIFSRDGQEFYFADNNSRTIQIMRRTADGWSAPETASFSGKGYDGEPYITADNNTLYFISTRPPGTNPMNGRIWRTHRQPSGAWSEPELVLHRETDAGFWYPVSPEPGVLYFGATLGDSFGEGDFYRATQAGDDWDIEHLPAPFNTPDFDWDPYFSHDENYMLFQSKRPDGLGQTDIYVSFQIDGQFATPINVGAPINSPNFETAATITPDGKYMFYTVVGPDHPSDIFWVSTRALTKLKNN